MVNQELYLFLNYCTDFRKNAEITDCLRARYSKEDKEKLKGILTDILTEEEFLCISQTFGLLKFLNLSGVKGDFRTNSLYGSGMEKLEGDYGKIEKWLSSTKSTSLKAP